MNILLFQLTPIQLRLRLQHGLIMKIKNNVKFKAKKEQIRPKLYVPSMFQFLLITPKNEFAVLQFRHQLLHYI